MAFLLSIFCDKSQKLRQQIVFIIVDLSVLVIGLENNAYPKKKILLVVYVFF